ncbi:hypothetical protein BGZ83_007898 [Gryganskiella cystojenkinii]|nr:hypothetical protein BGZ83_007898 [Gryganskiella cystojenkinii]
MAQAGTWKVIIQNGSLSNMQELIRQSNPNAPPQYNHHESNGCVIDNNDSSDNIYSSEQQGAVTAVATPPLQQPMLKVLRETIPSGLRDRAKSLLGIEFGPNAGSCFMDMTPLQFAILVQRASTTDDRHQSSEADESRVRIIDLLLEDQTPEEVTRHSLGDNSNVLHLAAFLGLKGTLERLVQFGCDPSVKNGLGFNAIEIMSVMDPSEKEEKEEEREQQQTSPGEDALSNVREVRAEEALAVDDTLMVPVPESDAGQGCEINDDNSNNNNAAVDDDTPRVMEHSLENSPASPLSPIDDSRSPYIQDAQLLQLIEQDAIQEQMHHHSHQIHFLSEDKGHRQSPITVHDGLDVDCSEDDDDDVEDGCYRIPRDPSIFQRIVLIPSTELLFSILKPCTSDSMPLDVAADAYQAYLIRLNVQRNPHQDLPLDSSRPFGKSLTWKPVKEVQLYLKVVSSESDLNDKISTDDSSEESDDDKFLERYYEPVFDPSYEVKDDNNNDNNDDHNVDDSDDNDDDDDDKVESESPKSMYTLDRPITPHHEIWSQHHNSSLDLSSQAVVEIPLFPKYQRPLPPIPPQETTTTTSVIKTKSGRVITPPPPLQLSRSPDDLSVTKKAEPLRSPPPPAPYTHLALFYKRRRSFTPTLPPSSSQTAALMSPIEETSTNTQQQNILSSSLLADRGSPASKKVGVSVLDLDKPLPSTHPGARAISSLRSTIRRKWSSQHPFRSLSGSILPTSSSMKVTTAGDDQNSSMARHTSLPISIINTLPLFDITVFEPNHPQSPEEPGGTRSSTPVRSPQLYSGQAPQVCHSSSSVVQSNPTQCEDTAVGGSGASELSASTVEVSEPNWGLGLNGFVQDTALPQFQILDQRREKRNSIVKDATEFDKASRTSSAATTRRAAYQSQMIPDLSNLLPRLNQALQTGLQAMHISKPTTLSTNQLEKRTGLEINPSVGMSTGSATASEPSTPTSPGSTSSSSRRTTPTSFWNQRKKFIGLPTIVDEPSSSSFSSTSSENPVDMTRLQSLRRRLWTNEQDTFVSEDDDMRSILEPEQGYYPNTPENLSVDDLTSSPLIRRRTLTSCMTTKRTLPSSPRAEPEMEFEEICGVSGVVPSTETKDGSDFTLFASTMVNFERLLQDDKVQGYTLRRSVNVGMYSDCPNRRRSTFSRVTSAWQDMTAMESEVSRRRTLSNRKYPPTIDTGVLYMRIKNIEQFSLPILEENTMASIRIDTGFEKVDTDYVPLDDIKVLFNQEFCLPVCPGLAITLTLHLMQAPHLQPRCASRQVLLTPSPDSGSSNQGLFAEQVHRVFKVPVLKQEKQEIQQRPSGSSRATPIAWARAAASSSSTFRQKLLPPSLFKATRPQQGTPSTVTTTITTVSPGSETPVSAESTPGTSSNNLDVEQQVEKTSNSRTRSRVLSTGPTTQPPTITVTSRVQEATVVPTAESTKASNNMNTLSKWKNTLTRTRSAHRRQKTAVDVAGKIIHQQQGDPESLQEILSIEEVEIIKPFSLRYPSNRNRKSVQSSIKTTTKSASTLVRSIGSTTTGLGPSATLTSASSTPMAYIPPSLGDCSKPQRVSKLVRSSTADRSTEKLSMSEIRSTETPLEILTRHIQFEDENCIGRSGIVFRELQSSCENTIVPVDFVMVNNWVDRHDYGRVLPSTASIRDPKTKRTRPQDRLLTPPQEIMQDTQALGNGDDTDSESGSEAETGEKEEQEQEEEEEESIVAKVSTSLCFIPGPMMDPEDAIYEDPNHIPTEPQNLQDCQFGLFYFRWQDRVLFEAPLFYLTERGLWKEGQFILKGSLLLQKQTGSRQEGGGGQRCLNLETVKQLQTNRGIFKATAQYLDGEEEQTEESSSRRRSSYLSFEGEEEEDEDEEEGNDQDEDDDSFYPVRNGFRLKLRVPRQGFSWRRGTSRLMVQDFHAASPELAQAWVSAIMKSCRERPPTPYWLR